jgi:hypothetical protein
LHSLDLGVVAPGTRGIAQFIESLDDILQTIEIRAVTDTPEQLSREGSAMIHGLSRIVWKFSAEFVIA